MSKVILTLYAIPNEERFSIRASGMTRPLLVTNGHLLMVEDTMPPETPSYELKFALVPLDTPIDWDHTNSSVLGVVKGFGGLPLCLMEVW